MTLRPMPLIDSIETADRAMSLRDEWEELRRSSSAQTPFLTWPWVGSWLETAGAEADLVLVTARDPDSGRLVGIAPFQVATRRSGGADLRDLRFLGSGVAAPDHLDLIVADDAGPDVAAALWAGVGARRRWDLLNLDGMVTGGHLAAQVLRRRDDRSHPLPCPYLPLGNGWEATRARFEGRLRNNLTRYGRKLATDAEVSDRMITDPSDLDDTFDHLVRFHQSVRTSKGDTGVFAQPVMRRFLRRAAHAFLEAGRLRMWRLDANGSPIAVIMCIRTADSVAFYTTGYDQAWSKYGPGRQIMARAIAGAIAEGATEFDFLRGDEPYKRAWGTTQRTDLIVRRPITARGRFLVGAAAVVRLTRRLRRGAD